MKSVGVQQNLKWSRPNQQVEDEKKAGNVVCVKSHERMNDCIGVSLGFLASLGTQSKSLAEDHCLDGAFHVNRAA